LLLLHRRCLFAMRAAQRAQRARCFAACRVLPLPLPLLPISRFARSPCDEECSTTNTVLYHIGLGFGIFGLQLTC
jgi:hypothetical protein